MKIWATNRFTKMERGISVWLVRLVEVGHLLKSQEDLDQKEQKWTFSSDRHPKF